MFEWRQRSSSNQMFSVEWLGAVLFMEIIMWKFVYCIYQGTNTMVWKCGGGVEHFINIKLKQGQITK